MQKNLPKYLAASVCVLVASFIPVYKAPIPDTVGIHSVKPKQIAALADVLSPEIASADPVVIEAPKAAPVASMGVTGCGSDPYMAYIYQHESGCRTDAINPIGACGLGQALPCSKMGCSLSDWGCQDSWFRNYAISVYGSTYNAYQAWLSKSWW